jgi:hypothetical protein
MRGITLIILLVVSSTLSFGQKEGNNWYFGNNAGIDFNPAVPVAHTNGQLSTWEGCSSISDSAGGLLFYTDGSTVWDKNHNVMPNGTGLLGNSSASQSAVVVPKPGTYGRYYIFTVPAQAGASGLRYSELDLSLNGGNGDVLAANKNTLLHGSTTEKITATQHANGIDFWVVSHDWNSDAFRSILVTATGVNPVPVLTNIGITHTGGTAFTIGCMKISPDGRRIVNAPSRDRIYQVADFNSATGVVSNIYSLTPPTNILTYGVEFSPNSNILYATPFSPQEVYQYDLLAGSTAAIQASVTTVGIQNATESGSLQLGPDGKIYAARRVRTWVGVINNPDVLGMGCNYVDNGVDLNGNNCQYGLPVFLSSIFSVPNFTSQFYCEGDSTAFVITDTTDIDSVRWNFGDPFSGSANSSIDWSPKHVFSQTGTFTVSLIVNVASIRDTMTNQVTIITTPNVNLGADDTLCVGDVVTLNAGNPLANYNWSNGDSVMMTNVTTSGTYSVIVNYGGVCSDTDSINLVFDPYPVVALGNDTAICGGGSLLLDAGTASEYQWSTGATTQTLNVTTSGNYWVIASNGICSDTDSISISIAPAPIVSLGPDVTFCDGDMATLDAGNPSASFLWSTGDTTQTLDVTSAGQYIVTVSEFGCSTSDTLEVFVTPIPVVNLGNDIGICTGETTTLDAGNSGATFLWSTGATTQTIQVSTLGTYWVQVSDGTCTGTDTIEVTESTPLPISLGPPVMKCPWETVDIDLGGGFVTYNWSTGETTQSITVSEAGNYWAYAIDANGCVTDTGYKQIVIEQCEIGCDSVLFVPNVFTPSAASNRNFYIRSNVPIRIARLQLFNRWGEVVFERRHFYSNDPEAAWDGSYQGSLLPPQVFAYYLQGECQDGSEIVKSGNVTLLK